MKGEPVKTNLRAMAILGAAIFAGVVRADQANPYTVISERNVFHLNPPPAPPAKDEAAPPPQVAKLTLSGFAQSAGNWKAFLAATTDNPDPHGQAVTTYLALSEGEKQSVWVGDKQGVVQLVRIHVDSEKADVVNCGTPVTLSFKDNGLNAAPPPLDPSKLPKHRHGFSPNNDVAVITPPQPGAIVAPAPPVTTQENPAPDSNGAEDLNGNVPAEAPTGNPQ